jgi:hypothetical protein
MTYRDAPKPLQSLYQAVEEALLAAEHAHGEAKKLELDGTRREIARAVCDLRGVMGEMDRRELPEFARFDNEQRGNADGA